ncbi:MAG: hypothetical protein HXX81_05305 [Campylobacterales bacterium]|nr:hypothetical protein [Campylobacterales bacterium]
MLRNIKLEDLPSYEIGLSRGLTKGLESGLQKGIEKGIQRGIEKGLEIAIISMNKLNISPLDISKSLNLPLEKVEKILNESGIHD